VNRSFSFVLAFALVNSQAFAQQDAANVGPKLTGDAAINGARLYQEC
jgi:hypothetical protein